jgi:TRAP-type C4-dicarboxylate transport system permease small subunit
MGIKTRIQKTYKAYYSITEVAAWVGYAATVAIVFIVFVDVCGRYFINAPLRGSFELVEQTMVLSGGFAIIYSTVKRGHIIIDVIFNRLPKRIQAVMSGVFSLAGFGISVGMAYYLYLFSLRHLEPYPQVTTILKISTSPFQFGLAVAMALCGIVFLMQTFELWVEGYDKQMEGSNF